MNKPFNPASVGLRSYQLEDVERHSRISTIDAIGQKADAAELTRDGDPFSLNRA
ncbi:MAG TPA: hypothetical protein VIF02_01765 [Methylocella sp.]|jgi:hypothetical protein